jgi:hypothetical protein
MATVPHLTAWAGRTKYYADGFLFDRVYRQELEVLLTYSFHFCNMTLSVVNFNCGIL